MEAVEDPEPNQEEESPSHDQNDATPYIPPDNEEQAIFEADNLDDNQRAFLAQVRQINVCRTLDLTMSAERLAMANLSKGSSGKLMADGCADTCIAAIGNGFTEVSRTERTITLVGFDADLTKKDIPIGSAVTVIDLPRGPVAIQLNETPLLENGSNSLLSTAQAREFGVIVDDVAIRHGGKQHIQADNLIIPMKMHRSLLYVPIREPTEWELNHLPRIHLTSDEVWDPARLNDALDGKVIYPSDDDLDGMDDYLRMINFTDLDPLQHIPDEDADSIIKWIQGERFAAPNITAPSDTFDYPKLTSNFGFVNEQLVKDTIAATTQLATNVLRLPLRRHFKSRHPQLNCPRLREEYSTDTLFSSVTGIGGHTCAQVFVGKSSKYGAVYGMITESEGGPSSLL